MPADTCVAKLPTSSVPVLPTRDAAPDACAVISSVPTSLHQVISVPSAQDAELEPAEEPDPALILERKLSDSALELSVPESVALLRHCVALGVSNAAAVSGKEAILVLGKSGIGKSTFLNYMLGCEMVSVQSGRKELIEVASSSARAVASSASRCLASSASRAAASAAS